MIFNKKIIFVVILLILRFSALSQPFVDIVNLRYSRFPQTDFKDYSNYHSSTNQYTAELFAPIQLKSKDVILVGASYDYLNFYLHEDSSNLKINSDNLCQFSLQLGMIKKLGKESKWSTTLLAIPKISECNDNMAFDKECFQMGGAVLFVYKKKNSLKYKFGLFYNREFFGNYFMPLAGIDWKISSRMYLFGVLPGAMNFEYKICDKFYTGLGYKSNTASYRLYENHYIREGDKFWGHNMLRNFYQYYITKQIMLYGEIGYTGFRIFEEYNDENKIDNTRFVFQKTKDHFYFDAGIAFRLRLDKDYED
ncbi:MAG TPA: DUF6268 family outer membrane beta-barrel protein [Bacteroidales bacterium]|nr:DUF6268 family outer membrane beta-barrel protein [Bacteroidales bacterium]HPS16480.1 DUF6268 family outer membrane beta-barrel protein [Bacteroidales bacterium]